MADKTGRVAGTRRDVPGLPPLDAVKDPAVREFLRALATGWEIRNNNSANAGFITREEFEAWKNKQ